MGENVVVIIAVNLLGISVGWVAHSIVTRAKREALEYRLERVEDELAVERSYNKRLAGKLRVFGQVNEVLRQVNWE